MKTERYTMTPHLTGQRKQSVNQMAKGYKVEEVPETLMPWYKDIYDFST